MTKDQERYVDLICDINIKYSSCHKIDPYGDPYHAVLTLVDYIEHLTKNGISNSSDLMVMGTRVETPEWDGCWVTPRAPHLDEYDLDHS